MLLVISPAKSLDFTVTNYPKNLSNPAFLNKTEILVNTLKKLKLAELQKLMDISPKLAELNLERYKDFQFLDLEIAKRAKPAIFVFDGDVYDGIDEDEYDEDQLFFAQNNLRILSGLYGVLRPMDLIQPYRLEMGVNFKIHKSKNIYDFWAKDLLDYFNCELEKRNEKIIINLASDEYCKVINSKKLNGKMINIIFKNNKNGSYKNIGFLSKKARGLMANFIIKNKIQKAEDIKLFNHSGYRFVSDLSDDLNWHFYN